MLEQKWEGNIWFPYNSHKWITKVAVGNQSVIKSLEIRVGGDKGRWRLNNGDRHEGNMRVGKDEETDMREGPGYR